MPAITKHEIEALATKPQIPFPDLASIPRSLQTNLSWVLWRYESSAERGGKWTKVLYRERRGSATSWLQRASSTDPRTWGEFTSVSLLLIDREELRRHPFPGDWGLGYCIAPEAQITVIDLDDARNRDTGEIAGWARAVITLLNSYTEVSPSGTGLKIFLRGTKPGSRCRPSKPHELYGKIEVYDRARFVAITGDRIAGSPADLADRQDELAALYADLFPNDESEDDTSAATRVAHEAIAAASLNLNDAEIISIASRARNGDRFERLWAGDDSDYASRSEADFALASTLAFYVGPDILRIESLMRGSGLARAKWNANRTYLRRTIERALHGRTDYYEHHNSAIDDEIAGIPDDWMQKVPKAPATPPTAAATAAVLAAFAAMTTPKPAPSSSAPLDELHAAPTDGCSCPHPSRPRVSSGDNDRTTTFTASPSSSLFRTALPPCNKKVLVKFLNNPGHAGWINVPCGRWRCSHCIENLRNTYLSVMLQHLDREPVEEFHAATVQLVDDDLADWKRLYNRIRRTRDERGRPGRYICILDFSRVSGNEFLIVSTVPFPGSSPLAKRHAIQDVREAITSIQACKKPISKCREWNLPVAEKQRKFEVVGEIQPWATEDDLNDVLARNGLEPAQVKATSGMVSHRCKIIRMNKFAYPLSWDGTRKLDDLFGQLRSGGEIGPDSDGDGYSNDSDFECAASAASDASCWAPWDGLEE